MKVISGNILNINHGVICHQVNCQGVMGAGLALQIKNKWPVAYEGYMTAYEANLLALGEIVPSMVCAGPQLWVVHMCGQNYYGKQPGKIYTDYTALAACLAKAASFAKLRDLPAYIPYGIGCGFAGGNWEVVSELIEAYAPDATVVRLG